ncbi:MAG: cobyric acid synthase [Candidatus Methanomethylophilaceae archaeon]|nr:cobyric acid synthase [Candidatus Methanomethylophilaceae archaeon]
MRSVLVLGTSSGAGKTTLCAVLCRALARKGMSVAPFKASNLSLNSYACQDGGEIGMGQAFQAWACGMEPESDMNPVLLKPAGNGVIQLVRGGRPYRDISRDSPMTKEETVPTVRECFGRLSASHDIVVCEGSGSPVELNLMDRDIANVGLMRELGIPAILVGDIERGGVFAAIYGTWRLIPEDLRPQLKGFIINRFRGDGSILKEGIDRIEELTGMKCLGVMPYRFLRLPEEDSMSSSEGKLEGSDVRSAFMFNLDEMTDAFLESGLDIEEVVRISESSA